MQYSANLVAEIIYDKIDEERRTLLLIDSITDHRMGEKVIHKRDITKNNRFTTTLWYLKVQ